MHTIPLLPLAIAGTLLAAAPALGASRTYDLPPFEAVSVSSGITAIVAVGGSQSVTAEAPSDAILNRLEVKVEGNVLELGLESNILSFIFDFGQRREIVVHVAAPTVRAVEATSGAALDATGMSGTSLSFQASSGAALSATAVAADTAIAGASSGASLTVSGTCNALRAETSSGGAIVAMELACADVDAEASSGGNLDVRASTAIKAEASSGGHVRVHGNPPRSNVSSSSGGSVDTVP